MGIWQTERSEVEILLQEQVNRRKGRIFSASRLFTGVADTNSVEMVAITGATRAGLTVLTRSTGQAEIEFEKDTTFTDNGTEVPSHNRKESSANTANATIYHTPNIDTSGTVFSHDLIPGGGGRFTVFGGGSEETRYGIEANSTHLVRVTNTSGNNDQKILIKLIWVAH